MEKPADKQITIYLQLNILYLISILFYYFISLAYSIPSLGTQIIGMLTHHYLTGPVIFIIYNFYKNLIAFLWHSR